MERAHRIPRRKRSHNKDNPCTRVSKLRLYEDKESLKVVTTFKHKLKKTCTKRPS